MNPQDRTSNNGLPLTLLLLVIAVITLYRAATAWTFTDMSLHFDEAQYWLWSQNLAWGYYSKPPMLAVVIRGFTDLFGSSEQAVRLPALVMYPLTTILVYYLAEILTKSRDIAFWSALTLLTMPAVSLSSLLITTDVVLFVFWTLSLIFLHKALTENTWGYWIATGITAGLGLMTKYTMGIFAVGALVYVIALPNMRHHLRNPKVYIGGLIAILIFLPNMVWNYDNGWPTIRHTEQLSSKGVSGLHPEFALTFIGEQFGVFGPVTFGMFLVFLFQFFRKGSERTSVDWFLFCFSVIFLLIITGQALKGRAYANWAAPTYVAASVIAGRMMSGSRKLQIAVLTTNIFLMLVVYHSDTILDWVRPNAKKGPDMFKTVRGWHEWADKVREQLDNCGECTVVTNTREVSAQTLYQLRDVVHHEYVWNPDHLIDNHYQLEYSLKEPQKGKFLLIFQHHYPNAVKNDFRTMSKPVEIQRMGKYGPVNTFYLIEATDFLGYR